jgi:UDP-3-O-[3-hydroxymyristoyl] glucosamine N-acyltransferase
MQIDLKQIQDILSDCEGRNLRMNREVNAFVPIEGAPETAAVWIRGASQASIDKVRNSAALVIVAGLDFPIDAEGLEEKTFFLAANPRLAFARLVRAFHNLSREWSIHPTAQIHPEAELAEKVFVGPYAVIGKAIIGEESVIEGHCTIHDNVRIGKRVVLHHHTCVGSDGFSFEWRDDGEIEKFLHIGSCVLEDDVEAYPFVNIDRGTLGTVRVGRGTKLVHFVHVGHNCTVGKNSMITAGVVLCGGCAVGDNVWVGVHSTIKEKCVVGDGAYIGLNSLIIKDVPAKEVWVGSPAKFLRNSDD